MPPHSPTKQVWGCSSQSCSRAPIILALLTLWFVDALLGRQDPGAGTVTAPRGRPVLTQDVGTRVRLRWCVRSDCSHHPRVTLLQGQQWL